MERIENEKGFAETNRRTCGGENQPAFAPPGGILVAMEAVAICRTDIKMVRRGHKDLAYPRVLGHEGVGVIVESENPLFETGVRVAVYPGSYCGACCACKGGHTGRCGALHIYGFNKDGFFRR